MITIELSYFNTRNPCKTTECHDQSFWFQSNFVKADRWWMFMIYIGIFRILSSSFAMTIMPHEYEGVWTPTPHPPSLPPPLPPLNLASTFISTQRTSESSNWNMLHVPSQNTCNYNLLWSSSDSIRLKRYRSLIYRGLILPDIGCLSWVSLEKLTLSYRVYRLVSIEVCT